MKNSNLFQSLFFFILLTLGTLPPSFSQEDCGSWDFLAEEDKCFYLENQRMVRYGANGEYRYQTVVGRLDCSNEAFGGDPIRGITKKCYICSDDEKSTYQSVDQSQTIRETDYGAGTFWQSFTAKKPGFLTQIDARIAPSENVTLKIYRGEGTNDNHLLYQHTYPDFEQGCYSWYSFQLTNPIFVEVGEKYTIQLGRIAWSLSGQNRYKDGVSGSNSDWDFVFKTYVAPSRLDAQHAGSEIIYGAGHLWQSFTPKRSGHLSRIDAKIVAGHGNTITLKVFEGEGDHSSNLIQEQSFPRPPQGLSWVNFVLHEPILVEAGKKYTFKLGSISWAVGGRDKYKEGRAGNREDWDFDFKTYVYSDIVRARDFITKEVNTVATPGLLSKIIAFSHNAMPIAVATEGGNNGAVIAAGIAGKGRVVTFGHMSYFNQNGLNRGDTKQLMNNSVRWSAKFKNAPIKIGISGFSAMADYLRTDPDFQVEEKSMSDIVSSIDNYDVIIAQTINLSKEQVIPVKAFLENGGGLLAADLAWVWGNNSIPAVDFESRGNPVVKKAGLAWTRGTIGGGISQITLKDDVRMFNGVYALNELKNSALSGDQKREIVRTLSQYNGTTLEGEIDQYFLEARNESYFPGGTFPGTITTNQRENKNIVLNKKDFEVPRRIWKSTGLYAAPGELIEVIIPSNLLDKNLGVQIGCHTDDLSGISNPARYPQIVRHKRLINAKTSISSPFGGLIYITIPEDDGGQDFPDHSTLSINNAVAAPYFVLGETDLNEWQTSIRNHPAPWAEIASGTLIITVPSEQIRALDNPVELMEFWDEVQNANADLAVIPRERPYPERFVSDIQIAYGLLHAGYPIMFPTSLSPRVLTTDIANAGWGFYHELGHNHDEPVYMPSGTSEVTPNFWTLYVIEQVSDRTAREAYEGWVNRSPEEDFQSQFDPSDSRNMTTEKWKMSPDFASVKLVMYLQLKEAFGWGTYKKVFKEYSELPADQKPTNDVQKRDQWCIRFSKACGYNLAPFFDRWDFEVSERAKEEVDHLPIWMPYQELPSEKEINYQERIMSYENIAITPGPIYPGSEVSISFDWKVRPTGKNGYCPGCIIQFYVGMNDKFSECMVSTPLRTPNFQQREGHFEHTFTAPSKPGVYYITQSLSLKMSCQPDPGKHNNTIHNAIAMIHVTTATNGTN